MPFPDPQGMCATATRASARRASLRRPSPLKTSYGKPSPERQMTASVASTSNGLSSTSSSSLPSPSPVPPPLFRGTLTTECRSAATTSAPCPRYCVSTTVRCTRAASKMGRTCFVHIASAFPWPALGLMRTVARMNSVTPKWYGYARLTSENARRLAISGDGSDVQERRRVRTRTLVSGGSRWMAGVGLVLKGVGGRGPFGLGKGTGAA